MTARKTNTYHKAHFFLPEEAYETSVQQASGDAVSPKSSVALPDDLDHRAYYGPVSTDFEMAAERGLQRPANQNKRAGGGTAFGTDGFDSKYITLLKIGVPIGLGLAFLAWF